MYRALYRKWRPATFSDVIGQESIVTALQSQLLHDKVGHAYIFTGTRGTGKTTCAKIFAKAVNCESRNGADPCCVCSTCKGIETGAVMDVVEIDAASNNGVDNIRDLRDETAYTPSIGQYKVYIIDEVHMLSTAAFNALLKIMEEPPSHVIFILATTEIHKVPATILSRCQRYDFMRIAPQAIAQRLLRIAAQEEIHLTPDAAELIARLADGAMRDALSILDTCAGVSSGVDTDTVRRMAGVTDKTYLFTLSDAVASQDVPGALALIAQLREKSVDIKRLCDELVLHYRNIMLAGVSGGSQLLTGVSADEEARYVAATQHITQGSAIRAVKAFCSALDKMGKSADARIELELAVFALCGIGTAPVCAPMVQTQAAAQGYMQATVPYAVVTPQAEQTTPNFALPSAEQPAPTQLEHKGSGQDYSAMSVAEPPAISVQTRSSVLQPQSDAASEATVAASDIPWKEALEEIAPAVARTVPPVPHTEFGTMDVPSREQNTHGSAHFSTGAPTAPPDAVQQSVPSAPQSASTGRHTAPQDAAAAEPFALWGEVITAMETRDKMLFVNMRNSKAYFDGKRVRIDGSELFLEYMRRNQYSSSLIREVIEQVTGRQYPIGPYEKPNQPTEAQGPTAEQALAQLAAQGVSVVYQD